MSNDKPELTFWQKVYFWVGTLGATLVCFKLSEMIVDILVYNDSDWYFYIIAVTLPVCIWAVWVNALLDVARTFDIKDWF